MEEPWLFMLLVSIVSFIALDELSYLLKLKNLQKIIFLAISLLSFIFFSRSNFIDIKNILYASLIFWVFFVPFHFILKFQVPKKINLLYGFILIIPLWISITFLFSYNKFLLLFIFVSIFIGAGLRGCLASTIHEDGVTGQRIALENLAVYRNEI